MTLHFKTVRAALLVSFCLLGLSSPLAAATKYVSPSGSNVFGVGSQKSPWKTIGYSLRSIKGGDTLVIKDGIYASDENAIASPPSGRRDRYTVIRSENDGGAVVKATKGLNLGPGTSFVQIEGLKFDAPWSKVILGHDIKILRTAFKGGIAQGNTVQVGIGSKDFNNTENILLEDCWIYGTGGRYNLLVYNARNVVLRRVVIRHDGGWADSKGDPEAATCAYNSSHVFYQNVLVLDSDLPGYKNWYGAFYATADGSESDVQWRGCIALNNRGTGFAVDPKYSGALNDILMEDVVSYGNEWGITLGSRGTVSGRIERSTVGRTGAEGDGIAKWRSAGAVVGSNVLAVEIGGTAFRGLSVSSAVTHRVGSDGTGGSIRHMDPFRNGFLHLPRVEKKSPLRTAGAGSSPVGADVTRRIGSPGSLPGDSGWNGLTDEPLWPWPNEKRISRDLAEVAPRGFVAEKKSLGGGTRTLTSYVWDFLGNPCPSDVCAP